MKNLLVAVCFSLLSYNAYSMDQGLREDTSVEMIDGIPFYASEEPYSLEKQTVLGQIEFFMLAAHKRTHTGEKLHHCDQCDCSYTTSGSLTIHMRTHTGEKPHHCDQCDYSCATSSSLKKHMRMHTREKPYHCDQCDYSCANSSNLTVHKRRHHAEKRLHTCNQLE